MTSSPSLPRKRRSSPRSDCHTPAPDLYPKHDRDPAGGSDQAARATIAVDRVTATIRHGEFFGIVGPTGCGKTTLLRLISRFPIPASVGARS
ncbi:ATP-binding cassette domain-containing protein [Candidatus Bipolaricaulota bacterium]|nr:ATP-binding cassette domain-containing protein [Candidatus Bipolaricaulota bacterium]